MRSKKIEIEEARRIIKKLFDDGYSKSEITRETGYRTFKIQRHLGEMGLTYCTPPLTEGEKAKVVGEYEQGKGINSIQRENQQFSTYRIRNAVEEAGYEVKRGLRPEKIDLIKSYYKRGLSASHTSRELNCARKTVSNYYNRFRKEKDR